MFIKAKTAEKTDIFTGELISSNPHNDEFNYECWQLDQKCLIQPYYTIDTKHLVVTISNIMFQGSAAGCYVIIFPANSNKTVMDFFRKGSKLTGFVVDQVNNPKILDKKLSDTFKINANYGHFDKHIRASAMSRIQGDMFRKVSNLVGLKTDVRYDTEEANKKQLYDQKLENENLKANIRALTETYDKNLEEINNKLKNQKLETENLKSKNSVLTQEKDQLKSTLRDIAERAFKMSDEI